MCNNNYSVFEKFITVALKFNIQNADNVICKHIMTCILYILHYIDK